MTFDPSKLTPGPWEVSESCVAGHGWDIDDIPDASYRDARFGNYHDAAFIGLSSAAFDVMMNRQWEPHRYGDGTWGVDDAVTHQWPRELIGTNGLARQDPFTALVEADKWYRENVEKKP